MSSLIDSFQAVPEEAKPYVREGHKNYKVVFGLMDLYRGKNFKRLKMEPKNHLNYSKEHLKIGVQWVETIVSRDYPNKMDEFKI